MPQPPNLHQLQDSRLGFHQEEDSEKGLGFGDHHRPSHGESRAPGVGQMKPNPQFDPFRIGPNQGLGPNLIVEGNRLAFIGQDCNLILPIGHDYDRRPYHQPHDPTSHEHNPRRPLGSNHEPQRPYVLDRDLHHHQGFHQGFDRNPHHPQVVNRGFDQDPHQQYGFHRAPQPLQQGRAHFAPYGVDPPVPHRDQGPNEMRSESHFKLDLPEFHGSLNPEDFVNWFSTVERM